MKRAKTTKGALALNDYAHTYKVELLNHFNPELQLKNMDSAIKKKLKKLWNELTGFDFLITLVLKGRNNKQK